MSRPGGGGRERGREGRPGLACARACACVRARLRGGKGRAGPRGEARGRGGGGRACAARIACALPARGGAGAELLLGALRQSPPLFRPETLRASGRFPPPVGLRGPALPESRSAFSDAQKGSEWPVLTPPPAGKRPAPLQLGFCWAGARPAAVKVMGRHQPWFKTSFSTPRKSLELLSATEILLELGRDQK